MLALAWYSDWPDARLLQGYFHRGLSLDLEKQNLHTLPLENLDLKVLQACWIYSAQAALPRCSNTLIQVHLG